MALPLKPGLTPNEVAFLCEMELVNIVPQERLESLPLLSGTIPPSRPPFTSRVPLWLALLLSKQRKARLVPPPWLSPAALTQILEVELDELSAGFSRSQDLPEPGPGPVGAYAGSSDRDPEASDHGGRERLELSPPFVEVAASDRLPYHWLELATLFLSHADMADADTVRRLVRDIREARAAKIRRGTRVLDSGAGVKMNGVGAMEMAEARGFITGVVDGLRAIGASREAARREGGEIGSQGVESDDDDDDDNDGL